MVATAAADKLRGDQAMFYSDYKAPRVFASIRIFPFSHAYLEFNQFGYVRSVDLSQVVWG